MSKTNASKVEKYSKNDGGLFKITLFADSRGDRKNYPGPLILERFLEPKSPQDRENMVSKSLQKSSLLFISFSTDFGSILDPTSHPKINYFSSIFALGVALGPSWRQEGAQSAPRQLQRSIFQEFCAILGSILNVFSNKL